MAQDDVRWMKKALAEAAKGWGTTSPNPLVGAVVVRNGRLLGAGHHVRAGCAHAEVNAIAACGRKDLRGATIYVTLEPCSTTGRTPPCTEAILKAGISRVVFGCTDPNPKHAGRAAEILRSRGVEVTYPVCEAECRRLNEPFFKWITAGKPYVLLKMAQTLDGKTAARNGVSQWITGEPARRRVQKLRMRADAVMAGAETFRLDSPRFTVRKPDGTVIRTPRRIIVTRSPGSFRAEGFEAVSLPDPAAWDVYLKKLGSENVTALLIEGGGTLAASALTAHAVDRIEFHIAPKLLGGAGSRTSVDGPDPENLDGAVRLKRMEIRRCGDDLIYSAAVEYPAGKEG
ncbi:MAG: bifunctional diaminohydroxyphosphoribosylaminopyrimidine deaminase/5-amino-6-(5-phosphoribosylamino)uracil reductase RibD [Lentisphaeria bacterium]|nr:bifunctional diaminohydroxyphosphoribosylaminopyrimidine deaminase/5-amino-6-(5-phosphoribosylamino)uracil reductase RibD [Lentisphaeria bacterium]